MALLYSPTATASVSANTNAITVAGLDLNAVLAGMVIHLGARDRITGDGYIVASVTPNGTSGGTLTTVGPVPTAFTNTAFVVDTRDFNGTAPNYLIAMYTLVLTTLLRLTSPLTNLFSGSRVLALDKDSGGAVSRLLYAIAGRTWAGLEQRTLTYTPTGGAATPAETLGLRAYPDGTTPSDAILIDLSTGGVDVQMASSTMVSGTTVDLASAPTGKVAISGSATIASFGAGKHKVREVYFPDGGAILTHNTTSLILPGGASITTRAGDMLRATSDGAGNWRVRSYQRADGTPLAAIKTPIGQCRLVYGGASTLTLTPFHGNQIFVAGGPVAIPSGGVGLANTGLIAGTLYYVYAYLSGGALALEASTTGRATDATYGHQIKSGDASRTLVGAAYMDTGSPGTFADTPAKRYVATWFNRVDRALQGAKTQTTTASTSAVELDATQRVAFISWGDDAADITAQGYHLNNAAGTFSAAQVYIDTAGFGPLLALNNHPTANSYSAGSARFMVTAAEGLRYAAIYGQVNNGTATFQFALSGGIRS